MTDTARKLSLQHFDEDDWLDPPDEPGEEELDAREELEDRKADNAYRRMVGD